MSNKQNRREFLCKTTGAVAAGAMAPYWFTGASAAAQESTSKNDRPVMGAIGAGSRAGGVVPSARRFADVVAVCDVDRHHLEKGKEEFSDGKADTYEDYRKILDRKDIDIVTIIVPDHWHTKIAIEALQAGKDIYCEKPLTLTIDEGKKLRKVVKETGRVFQVGTQQRSNPELFLKAIALVHAGRIGKVKRVTCSIGGAPSSGPLEKTDPPSHLNWERWLGQTPLVDYIERRCHYEFRWWYEYSGGKLTDWGAHHVDIATWGIGMEKSGPTSVESLSATHPVPFEDGYPTIDNEYNTATEFNVQCMFPNGVKMIIRHDTDNGILFEGTEGRIFVNRGRITGKPVEDLADNPLPEDAITRLYKGKEPGDHMRNFFECLRDRSEPVSDVFTHLRALDTCHLANIALRLGRKLNWDAEKEQIVGDDEANSWLSRNQRQGYEIKA